MLLFGGSDLLTGVGAVRAVSGRHWTTAALDISSLGFAGVATIEEREARSLERLSQAQRSEFHALSETIKSGHGDTTASLQQDLERAIGAHRAARFSSEDLRRAVFVERLASVILSSDATHR